MYSRHILGPFCDTLILLAEKSGVIFTGADTYDMALRYDQMHDLLPLSFLLS